MRHQETLYGGATVGPITIRSDGQELASSGFDGRIRLWDMSTKTLRAETEGITPGNLFSVTAVAHCPDKDLLITCGLSLHAQVRAWDTKGLVELRAYRPTENPVWGTADDCPTATAIDPDGTRFAVGLANGSLHFFRTDSEKPERTVEKAHVIPEKVKPQLAGVPFAPAMMLMDWSRDGNRVVTAGLLDKTVKVWDPPNGEPIKEWSDADPDRPPPQLEELTGMPVRLTTALTFEPDGKHVLTGTSDGDLLRWDAGTGELVERWAASTGPIYRITFSKEGRWAAVGGSDQVVLWDWTDRRPFRTTVLPPLDLNPRAAAKEQGILQGFRRQEAGTVFGLAFTPDLGYLAATQPDGSLSLIDIESGTLLHRSLCSPYPEQGDMPVCLFTKDQELITVDAGGLTRWGLHGGSQITALDGDAGLQGQRIAVAPDGKQWATRGATGVTLWTQDDAATPFDGAAKAEISQFKLNGWPKGAFPPADGMEASPDRPAVLAYTPDGRRFVIGNDHGSAVVWDRGDAKIHAVFAPPRPFRMPSATHFVDIEAISTIAVAPDSSVAATNTQGRVRALPGLGEGEPSKSVVDVWSLEDGKLRTTLEWDGERIVTLAFRPGGKDLAALDEKGRVTVWDWRAKAQRYSVQGVGGGGAVRVGLAYYPDGTHFVQSGLGADFQSVDAEGGHVLQKWQGHLPVPSGGLPFGLRAVFCLAFDKSGRLASAGSDAAVRIWERDDQGQYKETSAVSTLRFSSYGEFGPEAEEDRLMGRRTLGIRATRGQLDYLVFAPDGRSFVTGGLVTKLMVVASDPQRPVLADVTPSDTARIVGLRLDGERLVPIERNRLIRRAEAK